MAYTLQGIIVRSESTLGSLPHKLQAIPLRSDMVLLPLTTEALKTYGITFCPLTDEGEEELPPALQRICEQLSERCSLAYIEAEFFGGGGSQAHALFSEGMLLGKTIVSESAINDALRYLGVAKGDAVDEFEAVGLGQHRNTDAWKV
jgi:hypothetical protein